MTFKYSCFFSYRSSLPGRRNIAELLKEDIATELSHFVDEPVFFDDDRLRGGHKFPNVLAEALCGSVCMIMVYTPNYFHEKHTFCAREYFAMKQLEEERLASLTAVSPSARSNGLIIPIIVRGFDSLPTAISTDRHSYDFQHFFLGAAQPRKGNYYRQISEIADYIWNRYNDLRLLPDRERGCEDFRLPENNEIMPDLSPMLPQPALMPRV